MEKYANFHSQISFFKNFITKVDLVEYYGLCISFNIVPILTIDQSFLSSGYNQHLKLEKLREIIFILNFLHQTSETRVNGYFTTLQVKTVRNMSF